MPVKPFTFATAIVLAATLFMPGNAPQSAEPATTQADARGKPNRLVNELSPYLRQHAYNPVDWFAWGKEAFDKASRENKPIFLSVGYSTCHWCHVMEKESFSDPRIAAFLNKHFVSIKVDRERRPEVDETYMLATQILTRRGGWPNNVFMTPDLKPFHAVVYLPPKALMKIMQTISTGWTNRQSILKFRANRVSDLITRYMEDDAAAQEATPQALAKASQTLLSDFDDFNGGFGTAPKFPREMSLLFLLDQAARNQDRHALNAVTSTLDAMLNGGIHDHVAGGFHRYAIDNEWHVPHFEKMLYSQALVSQALTRAWQLTGNRRYRKAAIRTLDYAIEQMRHPNGGFMSAYDADSKDGEGTYYTYTYQELRTALGADFDIANKMFSVSESGNFSGRNIVYLSATPAELQASMKLSPRQFDEILDRIRTKLSTLRLKRERPHRDDKILASWNGLMIKALVDAATAFDRKDYAEHATRSAEFIWSSMDGSKAELKRTWYAGDADLPATQVDFALTALGFVAVSDLPGQGVWLERAKALANQMEQKFRDPKSGDFYLTASINTFIRPKLRVDSQIPSGNAVALELFASLAERDLAPKHVQRANRLLAALVGPALTAPKGSAYTLRAADRLLRGPIGPAKSLAKGKVKAMARQLPGNPGQIEVLLDIEPGWHINANKPLEDFFIPTEISSDGVIKPGSIRYPASRRRNLGFHDKELALFEGKVAITADLVNDADLHSSAQKVGGHQIKLSLQSCSDKVCLSPEQITLMLPKLTPQRE